MTENKLIECRPEALEELKGAKGWLNTTGDRYFFCISCARKDKPDQFGFFSFGDFIEIKDGVAYGIAGSKTLVNGQDEPARAQKKQPDGSFHH